MVYICVFSIKYIYAKFHCYLNASKQVHEVVST